MNTHDRSINPVRAFKAEPELNREAADVAAVAADQTTSPTFHARLATVSGVLGCAFLVAGTLALVTAAAAAEPIDPVLPIQISSQLPTDIPGGAPNATPTQAAVFAWQEFIALNWPAVTQSGAQNTRETADQTKFFGDPTYNNAQNPLVWHTYRGKAEIFPGYGLPPGGQAVFAGNNSLTNLTPQASTPYYGYDQGPVYTYSSTPIPAANPNQTNDAVPWINLDEKSQIGLDQIYAGVAAGNTNPSGNQILFMAKGSRAEFDYIAPLGWWAGVPPAVSAATVNYLQQNQASPPPGSTALVSFPNGTIELKAAWRKLGANEDASRFYTTTVRYYVTNMVNGVPTTQYVDDTFALLALHIIHKTPTAPYFIFATFEQADNITDTLGQPTEDDDGRIVRTLPGAPFDPDIVSHNAPAGGFQTFTPGQSTVRNPQGQLYYQNIPNAGLTEGTILVNRRKHAIPSDIIAVNVAAHQAIATYLKQNLPECTSPWSHYKLINVQYVPIAGKIPGQDYTKADAANFYQANSVVETDYNLQVFSGEFYPGPVVSTPAGPYAAIANTITDYNAAGAPFTNVTYQPLPGQFNGQTAFNMGGCMGCHGNMQQAGNDFSFLLGNGPVTSGPDTVTGTNGLMAVVAGDAKAAADATPANKKAPGAKPIQKYHLH